MLDLILLIALATVVISLVLYLESYIAKKEREKEYWKKEAERLKEENLDLGTAYENATKEIIILHNKVRNLGKTNVIRFKN